MKSLLICPAERPNLMHLVEAVPLVNLTVCGKPFIFYWIEFLAAKGAKHISILATDRPEIVRELVGDGSRWGVTLEVLPERHELSIREAVSKYGVSANEFLPSPFAVSVADHLPELADIPLFSSYADFFKATKAWLPQAAVSSDRIGVKEIRPGIWVGLHSKISATTKLTAPCWIGDCVLLAENVELGPGAIIESHSIVDSGATVTNSIITSDTFIGSGTEITDSIVIKNTLINWKHNSAIQITDPFLLASLHESHTEKPVVTHLGRLAALFCLICTAPLAFIWVIVSNLRAQNVLRELQAVDPYSSEEDRRTITCYEFANCTGLWQRWPQLWNVVCGEFAWVGNRPLKIIEAQELTSDFEKLWLKAPIGLMSQADAEGCFDKFSDEARAHSAFYAAHPSKRRDLEIFWKVIAGCGKRNVTAKLPLSSRVLADEEISLGKPVVR